MSFAPPYNSDGENQISRDEMRRAFESAKQKAAVSGGGGERMLSLSDLLQEMNEEEDDDEESADPSDKNDWKPSAETDGARGRVDRIIPFLIRHVL